MNTDVHHRFLPGQPTAKSSAARRPSPSSRSPARAPASPATPTRPSPTNSPPPPQQRPPATLPRRLSRQAGTSSTAAGRRSRASGPGASSMPSARRLRASGARRPRARRNSRPLLLLRLRRPRTTAEAGLKEKGEGREESGWRRSWAAGGCSVGAARAGHRSSSSTLRRRRPGLRSAAGRSAGPRRLSRGRLPSVEASAGEGATTAGGAS